MAYVTGWAVQPYWLRYQFTKDRNWLRKRGYPAIRDCALFYIDFLKRGKDGLYHAFPSPEEESPFTDDVEVYTDRPQVMLHLRYCLRVAIRAALELGVDTELQAEWQDRLDHIAPDAGTHFGAKYDPQLQGLEKWCAENSPPQFGIGKPYRRQRGTLKEPSPVAGRFGAWWLAHPSGAINALRDGSFLGDRDYLEMRKYVEKTRHPNGMGFCGYFRPGRAR